MATSSLFTTLVLAVAVTACASGGAGASSGREPEAISTVRLSGPRGSLGGTELHNDPRFEPRTVTASSQAVWAVLPAVYRALQIEGAGPDSAQVVFGAVDFTSRRIAGHRLSRYLDCGMGTTAVPKADEYEVTISVLTRLAAGDSSTTVVTTSVIGRAKPRAQSGNAVYCHSQGTLEADIVRHIVTELSIDP
jgi:hypothetical protein